MKRAFTLIEVMIVVAILGIVAAIIIPEFTQTSQKARESAAKANLQILRDAIGRYSLEHNGTPPGYRNGALLSLAHVQLIGFTDSSGNGSATQTAVYYHGPYVKIIPINPFSGQDGILVIRPGETLDLMAATTEAAAKTAKGWIYDASISAIRLNWPGTDSDGVKYSSY